MSDENAVDVLPGYIDVHDGPEAQVSSLLMDEAGRHQFNICAGLFSVQIVAKWLLEINPAVKAPQGRHGAGEGAFGPSKVADLSTREAKRLNSFTSSTRSRKR
jgi:hypothetical protein